MAEHARKPLGDAQPREFAARRLGGDSLYESRAGALRASGVSFSTSLGFASLRAGFAGLR
jgi:hypothetical protein